MEDESDKEVAVSIIKETRRLYRGFQGCSFDKGFHSPDNQRDLKKLLHPCVLPKKGKLSDEQRRWEQSEEFKCRRNQHAAVESAINALENHSLDRCCDHGLEGFRRYAKCQENNTHPITAKVCNCQNILRCGDCG